MAARDIRRIDPLHDRPRAADEGSETTGAPQAGRHIAELVSLVLLIETVMWIVPLTRDPRLAYQGVAVLIILLLAVTHLRDKLTARSLGLRLDNFWRVLVRIAPPLGAFVAAMLLIGYLAGSLRFGTRFVSMLLFVPLWALLQHYILFGFAHRRFSALLGPGRRSVAASTALFSLMHLPNPVLTAACAIGGFIWARQYDREPNLLAHAITHGIASAVLANSLPNWLLKNMVVGYNFFFR